MDKLIGKETPSPLSVVAPLWVYSGCFSLEDSIKGVILEEEGDSAWRRGSGCWAQKLSGGAGRPQVEEIFV